jgi:hypothetical protein
MHLLVGASRRRTRIPSMSGARIDFGGKAVPYTELELTFASAAKTLLPSREATLRIKSLRIIYTTIEKSATPGGYAEIHGGVSPGARMRARWILGTSRGGHDEDIESQAARLARLVRRTVSRYSDSCRK